MSDVEKVPSGKPDVETSGQTQDQSQAPQEPVVQGKDSVSYETHRKLLAEKKKIAEQFNSLSEELNKLKEEKLMAEGNKEELINSLKKSLEEERANRKKESAAYAYKTISAQVEREALKMGCVDTEALIRLADLTSLEVGDDFSLDKEQVRAMLEKTKEERSWLFSKPAPNVQTGVPAKPDVSAKGLSDLSLDEKVRMLSKQLNQ